MTAQKNCVPLPVVVGLGVNGYGMTRGLARAGMRPVGLARDRREHGRRSRLLRDLRYFTVSPDEPHNGLVEQLRRLHSHTSRPLIVFPTGDDVVGLLTCHQEELGEFCRYHWNPAEVLHRATDKAAMGELCASLGIKSPRTERPANMVGVREAGNRLQFPVIVKPRTGGDTPFPPGHKNAIVTSFEDLLTLYQDQPSLLDRTLCQELVPGPDSAIYQVTALMRGSGRPPIVCCVRKVRQYPRQRGTTSFGVTEWNPALVSLALRLLEALHWAGIASIEFKLVPDGTPCFIELNPRLPWYNDIFAAAGVNLAALMAQDLTDAADSEMAEARRQVDGVTWGHLANDWASHRADQPAPGLRQWSHWAVQHATCRASAWRCLHDPLPAVAAYADLVAARARRTFQGIRAGR